MPGILTELRQRRVPQYVGGYLVAGWGSVQFVAFLEERAIVSPHLTNLVTLALAFILPSVVLLAWRHGRPGRDRWRRTEKILLPVNFCLAVALLAILFAGKPLGAVMQRVTVTDEHGQESERAVPKQELRRRLLIYYFESSPDETGIDPRDGRAVSYALALDLHQESFLDVDAPISIAAALRDAGYPSGMALPGALERKLADAAHFAHFVSGSVERTGKEWRLALELRESASGSVVATHLFTGEKIFGLIDQASQQLRQDLHIPRAIGDHHEDRPVAELVSEDFEVVRLVVEGVGLLIHANDWEKAIAPLEQAVARDSGCAAAHMGLYSAYVTGRKMEAAEQHLQAAMENIYRLPERRQFEIKAVYYFDAGEPEKSQAVLDMWTQLYPRDVRAYEVAASYARIRGEPTAAIAAYEQILHIDPSQHQCYPELAELYQATGQMEQAVNMLTRYAELYPQQAHSHELLAEFYRTQGRWAQARAALERAQILDPTARGPALELALIDLRLGRFEQARAESRRALDEASSPSERLAALENLLGIARTQGRIAATLELLEEWRQAARECRNPIVAEVQYAVQLGFLHEAGQAHAVLERLAASRPRIPGPNQVMVSLASVHPLAALGRWSEAEAALEEGESFIEQWQADVLRPQWLIGRGVLAEARGDPEGAFEAYRTARTLEPAVGRWRRYEARVLRKLGQLDAAERLLEDILQGSPYQPEANLELARLLQARGDDARAREALAKSLAAWETADSAYAPAAAARGLAAELAADG